MDARPVQTPVVKSAPRADGGLSITLLVSRPRWQRFLGGGGQVRRTFGMDALGREVYESCDGKRMVSKIIRDFATSHMLSMAQAEYSVTAFLKTLMTKGAVVMAVPRPK